MANILAVFAHPDDEAFGPSGTLFKLSKTNNIYLICATRGDGQKSIYKNLSQIRSKELEKSAKIIGIKKVIFLDFKDGKLCNKNYHKLANKIEAKVNKLNIDTLITYEPRGVSGHIDHIMVSMVCSYVFEKSKKIKTLLYFCLNRAQRALEAKYFIYFPPGYEEKDINMTVNINGVFEKKKRAILAHKSQSSDTNKYLKNHSETLKEEHFIKLTK